MSHGATEFDRIAKFLGEWRKMNKAAGIYELQTGSPREAVLLVKDLEVVLTLARQAGEALDDLHGMVDRAAKGYPEVLEVQFAITEQVESAISALRPAGLLPGKEGENASLS